jgi:hypothetical protein
VSAQIKDKHGQKFGKGGFSGGRVFVVTPAIGENLTVWIYIGDEWSENSTYCIMPGFQRKERSNPEDSRERSGPRKIADRRGKSVMISTRRDDFEVLGLTATPRGRA